jgi:hypothetical protein
MTMRKDNSQEGVAMITVMLIVVVLSLLMVATLDYAMQSEPLSRRDQDWNAALAAAQAGVDDYLYRLQQDDEYVQYSATNPPTPANVAFTGWHDIPGPANPGQFHYSTTYLASQGIIQVTSTGRVRAVQRTLRASLRRRGFLDYLYLTDFESLDPQSGYYSDPATAAAQCSKYWWQGRPDSSPPFTCVRISFVTGDTINGPLHTNDTISVNGTPRFNGKATTEDTGTMSCPPSASFTWRWHGLSGCGDRPVFQTGDPEAVPHLALPTTNTAIKTETDRTAGKTGCLYNGPTRIVLNSNGTMTVTSPFTTSAAYSSCVGSNVPLPANGVIYVQSVPTPVPSTPSCPASGNLLGYPIANDITDYNCYDGDAFVSGTLRGRLTIAAENNIVIVGDTIYQTTGAASNDMLGLVANNFVQVYHPVDAGGTNLAPFTNPQIHAAMLALGHSFIVQHYNKGAPLGTITINGVIAQKWRGPVGTSGGTGTGYLKNYGYDSRLQYASPPYVQDITKTPYRVSQWAEIQNPSGLPA